ncbi:Hypothetical protein PACV_56 [Pacmanvirus A23]|uniref:Hypothetical protein n=1 Tax=Pacmanvirus A23 TaxID=1932881 RepID=UPI000A09547B|nr:Hypothetical protein B9W72_gp056 [Pacmanvirus A23]SIP85773.1 Hypothetical protein PACV_56 [Pacmanvirus A23]
MSFDLESLAQEIGASTGIDSFDELYQDEQRIRDRIESRRAMMEKQVAADEIKAKLCDKIQAEKRKIPGLAQRISQLEETDNELFQFIRKLEYVNQGIWCPKCNVQKCVGGKQSVKTEQPVQSTNFVDERLKEQDEIKSEIAKVGEYLTKLHNEYLDKMKESSMVITELETKMNDLRAKMNLVSTQNTVETQSTQNTLNNELNAKNDLQRMMEGVARVYIPPKPESIVKFELPPKPEPSLDLDLSSLFVAEKITSDDLFAD